MQTKSKAKQGFRLGLEWIREFGSGNVFRLRKELNLKAQELSHKEKLNKVACKLTEATISLLMGKALAQYKFEKKNHTKD